MKKWDIQGELRERVREALSKSPWFAGLEGSQLDELIDRGELISFESGEAIVEAGQPSDAFYLLMKGAATVEVSRPGDGKPVTLGKVRPPFSFGEIGILLGRPRTASIIADDGTFVLKFGKELFYKLFDGVPSFRRSVTKALAARLAKVSELALPEMPKAALPPREVLELLPLSFVRRYRVLPLGREDSVLRVGLVDPPTPALLSGIREHLRGMELEPVTLPADEFQRLLDEAVASGAWAHRIEVIEQPTEVPEKLKNLTARVVAEGASDLHLLPQRVPPWRIDGDLMPVDGEEPLERGEALELLRPLMAPRHLEELEKRHDTDFSCTVPGVGRFRVNVFATRLGWGAAMRLIPSRILTLEELGMPGVLKRLALQPNGLIIVAGATGSGKSTTLAAMIDAVNRSKPCHIVTLEDPIEFIHRDNASVIDQREVGTHAESFARGLRAALREDPDIILVGEMRDLETASLVLEAANTGHLVLTTLHTNTAPSSIERLVDMFPAEAKNHVRTTLADTLRGVICQTLCKKRGGGRLAALEILVGSPAVANMIREGKQAQLHNYMQSAAREGNRLLNDDLARLVKQRKITLEEALSKSIDKADLTRRVSKRPGA